MIKIYVKTYANNLKFNVLLRISLKHFKKKHHFKLREGMRKKTASFTF